MGLLDTGTPLANGDSLTAESIQDKLDIIQDYLNGRNIGRGQLVHDGAIGCVTLSGPNLTLVSGTTKTLAIGIPGVLANCYAFAWSFSFVGLSTALTSSQWIDVVIKRSLAELPPSTDTIAEIKILHTAPTNPGGGSGTISPELRLMSSSIGSVIFAEFDIANEAGGIDMYCPQVTIWYRGQLTTVE